MGLLRARFMLILHRPMLHPWARLRASCGHEANLLTCLCVETCIPHLNSFKTTCVGSHLRCVLVPPQYAWCIILVANTHIACSTTRVRNHHRVLCSEFKRACMR